MIVLIASLPPRRKMNRTFFVFSGSTPAPRARCNKGGTPNNAAPAALSMLTTERSRKMRRVIRFISSLFLKARQGHQQSDHAPHAGVVSARVGVQIGEGRRIRNARVAGVKERDGSGPVEIQV